MRVTECRRLVRRVEVGVRPQRLRRLLAAVAAGAVLAGTGIGWAGRAHACDHRGGFWCQHRDVVDGSAAAAADRR